MDRIILVTEPLPRHLQDLLQNTASKLGFTAKFACPDMPEFADLLRQCEIFFGIYDPQQVIPENIKWICLPLAGVNNYLNRPELLNGRCILTSSSGAYGTTIAEHLIMSILMILRRMPEYLRDRQENIWRHDRQLSSIYGSRIVVLGTGDIGTSFASVAGSFHPRSITGVNRSGKTSHNCYTQVRKISDLDQILPETDILVMALPETPETIRILNRERIALLPDTAIVANVGRGSSIDEDALAEALARKQILGACLDVLEKEPPAKDNILLTLPNVLITPHMAGQRTLNRTVEIMLDQFLKDLDHYHLGEELEKAVDLHKGY
ncbi:MAG: D-2-hydroxyacid dehydrogenase [Succinivibrionaceae bacterium]